MVSKTIEQTSCRAKSRHDDIELSHFDSAQHGSVLFLRHDLIRLIIIVIFIVSNIQPLYSQTYRWKKICDSVPFNRYSFPNFSIDKKNRFIIADELVGFIWKSTDKGKTWQKSVFKNTRKIQGYVFSRGDNGMYYVSMVNNKKVDSINLNWWVENKELLQRENRNAICFIGTGKFFQVLGEGLIYSPDSGRQFYHVDLLNQKYDVPLHSVAQDTSLPFYFSEQQPTSLYRDWQQHIMVSSRGRGIFYSTDKGRTWKQYNLGLKDTSVIQLTANNKGQIFALTQSGSIYAWYKLIKKKSAGFK